LQRADCLRSGIERFYSQYNNIKGFYGNDANMRRIITKIKERTKINHKN